ncbi:MAG: efflux RND transporter permease subunit, partial [Deltaproteobacteria bacterium]|nr:efflux RND transporter permease subunit [Deltaproteobacteria bacterium]
MNPSHIAIRNPATVYILTLMLFIMGIMSYRSMPREAQPDIQIPLLIVSLPFPGASPEDVEALVTHKAEMALQNLDSLKEIKSTSAEGVSSIRLEFHLGFDVDDARVKVREKLDSIIPELPDDVEDPIITEINFSDTPMLMVNLAGDVGLVMLKEVAEDLKDDIEGIPGILEVNRAGGLEREIKVYVDPQKLLYYQLSLNQVVNAVERENTNIPGGTLTMGPTKYLIRVPGEFKSPLEINDVIIAAPGQQPIFVRDVARVEFGFREQTSHSRMDGQDSVSLVVIKRSGEHLLEIRDRIKKLVASYEGEYQGRIRFTLLADQGVFVGRIVRDLENNIITGFLLVFVTLLMVMGLRNSLFVAAAIPLSFLLTLICLEMLGFTLNFVVLFSLILALGMMVDNAIVVVENIFRHAQSGKGRVQSALEGISEVAVPVTTSTITTLVAFAPIIFMPGIPGEFMSYLPKTLIIALSSSLFVALVVNPVICATLMKQSGTGSQPSAEETQDEVRMIENSRWLLLYKKVLTWHLDRRWRVILATNVFFFLITGLYIGTTLIRK